MRLPWRRRDLGWRGEQIAASYLAEHGFRILGRRVRHRLGEIDILAERGELIVFVEVKTRRSDAFGQPAEAVDRRKARHLRRTALALQRARPELRDRPCRIDVIEVRWGAGEEPEVNHIPDAVGGDPE